MILFTRLPIPKSLKNSLVTFKVSANYLWHSQSSLSEAFLLPILNILHPQFSPPRHEIGPFFDAQKCLSKNLSNECWDGLFVVPLELVRRHPRMWTAFSPRPLCTLPMLSGTKIFPQNQWQTVTRCRLYFNKGATRPMHQKTPNKSPLLAQRRSTPLPSSTH